MVINNDTNRAKQKEAEAKLSRSDDEIKNEIFEKMRAESVAVITLAYYYAKNFEETGADITKRWQTMQEQNSILQLAYNKGYEEGLAKGREMEREKQNKGYPLGRNDWQE